MSHARNSDVGREADHGGPLTSRALLRLIAVAACVVVLSGGGIVGEGRAQAPTRSFDLMEATIPELQAALAAGSVTSRDLVTMYLARIDAYDQKGPALNAISAINGGALAEADALDAERKARPIRGPLHGIPTPVLTRP